MQLGAFQEIFRNNSQSQNSSVFIFTTCLSLVLSSSPSFHRAPPSLCTIFFISVSISLSLLDSLSLSQTISFLLLSLPSSLYSSHPLSLSHSPSSPFRFTLMITLFPCFLVRIWCSFLFFFVSVSSLFLMDSWGCRTIPAHFCLTKQSHKSLCRAWITFETQPLVFLGTPPRGKIQFNFSDFLNVFIYFYWHYSKHAPLLIL